MRQIKFNLGLIILIAVSVLLIFYAFPAIPANIDRDEVEFTRLALSLDGKAYIPYSPHATGHSTLYFYILLASFKLFGVTKFALRLPAALFGVGCTIAIYYLFSILFKKRNIQLFSKVVGLAFMAVFVFTASRWFFNFARFSYEATFLLFLELIALLLLLFFQKKKVIVWLVGSALFAGLSYVSYTPGRIFILVPLTYIFLNSKAKLKHLSVYLLYFIMVTLPLNTYLLQHSDTRIRQQFYISSSKLSTSQKVAFFSENLTKNVSMFCCKGDMNGRHNYPGKSAMNPIVLGLLILGLVSGMRKRNKYDVLMGVYFVVAFFPTLFTYPHENPHMLRTYTVLPAIAYFAVIGAHSIYELCQKYTIRHIIGLLLFSAIILSSVYEIRTYFKFQAPVFHSAFEVRTEDLQKAIAMPR